MGLFDYVRNSYKPLGEHFLGVNHTKDIEEGYGGTMSQYWISPEGQLYLIDYSHTADFVELQEGDPGYEPEKKFLNFVWIPNGNKGKVRPWDFTKYIEIHHEKFDGAWEDYPRLRLHFKSGRLTEWEDVTGR